MRYIKPTILSSAVAARAIQSGEISKGTPFADRDTSMPTQLSNNTAYEADE